YGDRIFFGDFYFDYSAGGIYPNGTDAITFHLWSDTDTGEFFELGWSATNSS
ncbi:hypothetical protein FRB97_009409, partial [Tulasnella sp. 331]